MAKKVWYTTQQEHWLGWLRDYGQPGYYGRKITKITGRRTAEYSYNHINYVPMLLWLAEASGVAQRQLLRAVKAVHAAKGNGSAKCSAFRALIPWRVVEKTISSPADTTTRRRSKVEGPEFALTVRQPLAWAIVSGYKDVENRSWSPTGLRPGQKFAVHASKARPTAEALQDVARKVGRKVRVPTDLERGAVVGVVEYRGVIGHRSSQWFEGPIAWRLGKIVRLQQPVRCEGQLGLWRLPKAVTAKVVPQLR
jgi:hypothetical protein